MEEQRRAVDLEDELNALDLNNEDDRYRVEEIVQSLLREFQSLTKRIDAFERRPTSVHRASAEYHQLVNHYNNAVDRINQIKSRLKSKLCVNNDQLMISYAQLRIGGDFSYFVST